MKIDGAIARDGGKPATKPRNVAQRAEAGKRLEKNILHQIFDRSVRDLREQNAVHHARVPRIQHPERTAIAVLRGLHQRHVAAAVRLADGVHGCQTWARRLQLKC